MYDKFPAISTNIKQRIKISDNKNTLAYYELREKSFIVQVLAILLEWVFSDVW